ncbi:MAG: hypothetical protein NW224_17070 [Leptolyngbyaceae cyanobacterium bins.302]|nr:hypothetical protein [Leptolyngbyaceae cyanobacterium bins.302]
MTVFVPVEEKQNLFRHIHTGKLYSYVPSQQGYHPVDEQGNPIVRSDAADYEEGEVEIVHELDQQLVNWIPSGRPTRCYTASNEEIEERLNQPDGVELV